MGYFFISSSVTVNVLNIFHKAGAFFCEKKHSGKNVPIRCLFGAFPFFFVILAP